MPTTQDTYEIVLKLKDEVTQALRQLQPELQRTKTQGQEVRKEVETIHQRFREASEPIRNFARDARSLLAAGGVAIVLRQVAQAAGQMQMAYEKANPEAARAAGSLTQWSAAAEEMKIKGGALIDSVLNPVRSVFIDMVAPTAAAAAALKEYNAEYAAFIAKYSTADQQKLDAYNAALELRKQRQEELTKAQAEYDRLVKQAMTERAGAVESGRGMAAMAGIAWEGQETAAGAIGPSAQLGANLDALAQRIAQITDELKRQEDWLKANRPVGGKPPAAPVTFPYSYGPPSAQQMLSELGTNQPAWSPSAPGPDISWYGAGQYQIDSMKLFDQQLIEAARDAAALKATLDEVWSNIGMALGGNIGQLLNQLGASLASNADAGKAFQAWVSSMVSEIGSLLIVAGLKAIIEKGDWPLGLALMAAGGLAEFGGGLMSGGQGYNPNPLPGYPSGGSGSKALTLNNATTILLDGEVVARSVARRMGKW